MIKDVVRQCVPVAVRNRLWRSRERRRYTQEGLAFSFTYFSPWELVKLQRYLNWQLPTEEYELSLLRTSADEFRALTPTLTNPALFPQPPKQVIDFGCGLGRSSIAFRQRLGWSSTHFLFLDGHAEIYGEKSNMSPTQWGFHQDVGRLTGNFYTNFDLLDRFLVANGMRAFDLIDMTRDREKLARVRHADLFYSFHSLGYHYDVATALDAYGLREAVRPGGLMILGVRRRSDPLRKELRLEPLFERGYALIEEIPGQLMQDFVILQRRAQSNG